MFTPALTTLTVSFDEILVLALGLIEKLHLAFGAHVFTCHDRSVCWNKPRRASATERARPRRRCYGDAVAGVGDAGEALRLQRAQFCKARMRAMKCAENRRPSIAGASHCHFFSD
jgi:hypothetical protein